MCPLLRTGLEPCWLQCSSHMAEQKTEAKPVFLFTFWKTSLPRSWHKRCTMLLSWGSGGTPYCLPSFLHSPAKQRNNLLLLLLTRWGWSVTSRKLSEAPQNCGPCFCFHLQTVHDAHTLVSISKTSIPQTHCLSFVVCRFLSSSPFPFSWRLRLWLNRKAVKCNSTRLGVEERNTWYCLSPPEMEVFYQIITLIQNLGVVLQHGWKEEKCRWAFIQTRTIATHSWLTQLLHSIRQKTTDSQREGRMAQKGCKCFHLSHTVLLKAPHGTVPLMFLPPCSRKA